MPHLTLFHFTGSNACMTAELALQQAGLEHERVDLLPGLHVASLKARGFPEGTVPALRIDDRRISGTRAICAEVHALAPEAGLLPDDPARRERVHALELRGERLQNAVRRLFYVAAADDRDGVRALIDGTGYRRLPGFARATVTRGIIVAARRTRGATADRARKDLQIMATALDELDAAIVAGDLGGEVPNAADLQFAPNVAALGLIDGLPGLLAGRPGWEYCARLVPDYPLDATVRLPVDLEQLARELLQVD